MKSLENGRDLCNETKTFNTIPRPRPRPMFTRPRPRLQLMSSRSLETKTLVSRTTTLHCRTTNKLITDSRRRHFQQRLHECTDPRSRWPTVNELLHKKERVHSTDNENKQLCATFSAFFRAKIDSLEQSIALTLSSSKSLSYLHDIAFIGHPLTHIPPAIVAEVVAFLKSIPSKLSPMDVIVPSLIKSCHGVPYELISRLAYLSFNKGQFPSRFKTAQITPLLKKTGLDKSPPENYRPISNLNIISKIL